MATDPLLAALDAALVTHAAFHHALVGVRDAVAGDGPSDPPPTGGELSPPADFRAVYNEETRRVTCTWTPQDDGVEIHERWKDPAATLKATVPGEVGSRESSELAGGPYEWAARSFRGDLDSPFTEWVLTDVARADDDEEQDEDEGEDDEGEDEDEDEPEDPPGGGDGTRPDEVLDLRLWTVMLPRLKDDGDTPMNDYASKWGNSYPDWFFVRDVDGTPAVVFRTPADGDHSKNSKYARTECREMVDTDWGEASWSSKGPRSLTCDLAIDASGLSRRKRINGMQIHDGGDDVCQIMRHEEWGLGLMHSDGKSWESIDPDYRDGERFTCTLAAKDDRITVDYNGRRVVDIPKKGSSWYYKFGCYLQSGGSSEFEEPAGASGEVVVFSYELQAA